MKQTQKTKQVQGQKQELTQTIDNAFSLDLEIKQKKKLLESKKADLKEYAKSIGEKELYGEFGKVEFSDEAKGYIDPYELYHFMLDLGMGHDFFDLVKVNLTEAKSKLGETILSEVLQTKYTEFAKMKFKKK